jgi:hypothetical protein
MKYHKNRSNYDIKSGRVVPTAPNFASAPVSKQTAFVPLAQEGSLKRNRPADFESPESTQRPVRARARRHSYAEDGDEGDDDEDEIMDDVEPTAPQYASAIPRSPSSGADLSHTLAKPSVYTPRASMSNGPAQSPAPAAAASWMTSFTPDDKAAALTWAVSRPQPVDFLDNLRSWIEFAETVSL